MMIILNDDYQRADYLSYGFVRQYSKDFPVDIATIVSKFIAMEIVYGFNSGCLSKMRVDEIIQTCLSISK